MRFVGDVVKDGERHDPVEGFREKVCMSAPLGVGYIGQTEVGPRRQRPLPRARKERFAGVDPDVVAAESGA
jgi:hypothetical protein